MRTPTTALHPSLLTLTPLHPPTLSPLHHFTLPPTATPILFCPNAGRCTHPSADALSFSLCGLLLRLPELDADDADRAGGWRGGEVRLQRQCGPPWPSRLGWGGGGGGGGTWISSYCGSSSPARCQRCQKRPPRRAPLLLELVLPRGILDSRLQHTHATAADCWHRERGSG
jgi:hypothetical protein